MAADQLRIFQSVAGKFGVSGHAVLGLLQKASRRTCATSAVCSGETMGFLQSQNQVVAQFAIKLKGTTKQRPSPQDN